MASVMDRIMRSNTSLSGGSIIARSRQQFVADYYFVGGGPKHKAPFFGDQELQIRVFGWALLFLWISSILYMTRPVKLLFLFCYLFSLKKVSILLQQNEASIFYLLKRVLLNLFEFIQLIETRLSNFQNLLDRRPCRLL